MWLIEYLGFWPGLMGDWQSNFRLQPVTMFATYWVVHGGLVRSEGARQVVVSKPGQAAGEAPRGSGTLLDINRADIAASVVGDKGLLDELQCQAETLKQDALHLQTSIDTARRRLEAEHGDLMGCIQTDMMAGSSTLCYSMLEASGVSADDAIANKAGAPHRT